ncbi:MAG TPA: GNAT family protein [Myxococcales bacterium]
MNDPSAVGDHLYLRPLDQDDAQAVVPWFEDQDVSSMTPSVREPTTFLQEIARSEQDVSLGICTKDGDRLIGLAGLHGVDMEGRSAMFGIVIGEKEHWGKGYGTEATALVVDLGFGRMNLQRIWLEVLAANERGIRAYEKVGFRREGGPGPSGSLVMAIAREDWKAAATAARRCA